MENRCTTDKSLLSQYIDGTLTDTRAWKLKMHLSVCADCAALAEELRSTVSAMRTVAPVNMSADFDAKLQARLAAIPKSAVRPAGWWSDFVYSVRGWRPAPALKVGFASASALVAIVGLVYGVNSRNIPVSYSSNPGSAAQGPRTTDADFVAACTQQHALYDSTQPIADPSAQALAERIDETGSATAGQSTPD